MTQLACWLLFPAILVILSLGCGLLLERAAGLELPGPLTVPAGLAVVICAGELTTKLSAPAPLTTPSVVALALAGFVVGHPGAASLALRPMAAGGRRRLVGSPRLRALVVFIAADRSTPSPRGDALELPGRWCYLNPPEKAIALCVDEETPVQ